MKIASVLDIHAATSAVPILLEEIEAAGVALPDDKSRPTTPSDTRSGIRWWIV
jgi:hypothetical protein